MNRDHHARELVDHARLVQRPSCSRLLLWGSRTEPLVRNDNIPANSIEICSEMPSALHEAPTLDWECDIWTLSFTPSSYMGAGETYVVELECAFHGMAMVPMLAPMLVAHRPVIPFIIVASASPSAIGGKASLTRTSERSIMPLSFRIKVNYRRSLGVPGCCRSYGGRRGR
jgi:hypothetical protein